MKRAIGVTAAAGMVAGESIALGIFLTPAAMAKTLGSPLLLCAVWIAMALMAFAGAVCFARLATAMPESGGPYVYLRHVLGERVAFLYGWMNFAVLDCGLTAALGVGAAGYVVALIPQWHGKETWVAAALIVMIAAVNLVGVKATAHTLTTLTWVKFAVLATLLVCAFASHAGSTINLYPLVERRPGSVALGAALPGAFISAFFSFGGWWDVTKVSGEILEPERNLPRALAVGLGAVALVYIALSVAFLYVVPLEMVTTDAAFVAQFGAAIFGARGRLVLSACVLVCVVGGLTALMTAAPRVYYAMAQAGSFPRVFGKVNEQGAPVMAALGQAGMALLLLGLGAFERIIPYFVFSAVVFLGVTAACALRVDGTVRLKVAVVVFGACCLGVALLVGVGAPWQAFGGAVVVLIGLALFPMVRSQRHTMERAAGL